MNGESFKMKWLSRKISGEPGWTRELLIFFLLLSFSISVGLWREMW